MLHRQLTIVLAASSLVFAAGCSKEKTKREPSQKPSERPAAMPAQATAHEPTAPKPSDEEITRAVERQLVFDPAVPSSAVHVATTAGVVSLTGTVPHLLAKERAVKLAETVKGVLSISNRLDVKPVERSDKAIAKDVRIALALDPVAESYEVKVSVAAGVVTLDGKVQSWQERDHAELIAKRVRGIRQVVNAINVELTSNRPDEEIKADVVRALRWDALIDDHLLKVQVQKGVVTVSGIAGTLAERARIARKAWVSGVHNVSTAGVKVESWVHDPDMRTRGFVPKDDAAIAAALTRGFSLDPRVRSYNVSASVENGRVSLTGTVGSAGAKQAAAMIARHTTGVVRVSNRLSVASHVSNAKLERLITRALARDPITGAYEIGVDVKAGVATLTGKVDNFAEKAEAADVAATVIGVTEVDNKLDVEGKTPFFYSVFVYPYQPFVPWNTYTYTTLDKTDRELEITLGQELKWNPFVDAKQVEVSVNAGVVTLRGVVDTWRERAAATRSALLAGAVTVHNELKVK